MVVPKTRSSFFGRFSNLDLSVVFSTVSCEEVIDRLCRSKWRPHRRCIPKEGLRETRNSIFCVFRMNPKVTEDGIKWKRSGVANSKNCFSISCWKALWCLQWVTSETFSTNCWWEYDHPGQLMACQIIIPCCSSGGAISKNFEKFLETERDRCFDTQALRYQPWKTGTKIDKISYEKSRYRWEHRDVK
jgi:hypothetical protein